MLLRGDQARNGEFLGADFAPTFGLTGNEITTVARAAAVATATNRPRCWRASTIELMRIGRRPRCHLLWTSEDVAGVHNKEFYDSSVVLGLVHSAQSDVFIGLHESRGENDGQVGRGHAVGLVTGRHAI